MYVSHIQQTNNIAEAVDCATYTDCNVQWNTIFTKNKYTYVAFVPETIGPTDKRGSLNDDKSGDI